MCVFVSMCMYACRCSKSISMLSGCQYTYIKGEFMQTLHWRMGKHHVQDSVLSSVSSAALDVSSFPLGKHADFLTGMINYITTARTKKRKKYVLGQFINGSLKSVLYWCREHNISSTQATIVCWDGIVHSELGLQVLHHLLQTGHLWSKHTGKTK